ncbi:hypothetical protein HAX54_051906 [Datura stramonium]|uniref:Uncharacterized protein n=1 Tax=Datura stramonium TaxID=4076 RepID=A0ABS8SYW2_DATST|nr:hypothetical protein [Datura stramonium]
MGQQTVDSKSSDHGQTNAKSDFTQHDKQLSVPVAIMGPALQDSQSENMVAASKSIESPLFPQANNMASKVSNITGSKGLQMPSEPLSRCSTNNSGSGHLVYVRRKPEGELSKTAANNNQGGVTDCPQLKKLSQRDEKTQTEVQMKEARCYIQKSHQSHGLLQDAPCPQNLRTCCTNWSNQSKRTMSRCFVLSPLMTLSKHAVELEKSPSGLPWRKRKRRSEQESWMFWGNIPRTPELL